jgi:hypothetical protein
LPRSILPAIPFNVGPGQPAVLGMVS